VDNEPKCSITDKFILSPLRVAMIFRKGAEEIKPLGF